MASFPLDARARVASLFERKATLIKRSCVGLGARTAVVVAAAVGWLCSATGALALPPFTTDAKSSPAKAGRQAELFAVAVGCHSGFDRFVVRARFSTPGYEVRYVTQLIGPSGIPVSVAGTARLLVVIRNARGHTIGRTNLLPAVVTPLCRNLRQIKKVEDFEGVVSFGLGVRRRTGFRVFRLRAPTRIVVDIAH